MSSELVNKSYKLKKSQIIGLPCEIGDTVYVLDSRHKGLTVRYDSIFNTTCEGFYIGRDGLEIQLRNSGITHGGYGKFGKTVFLTYEAAEQALKERAANA